jgi:hypothetical protein
MFGRPLRPYLSCMSINESATRPAVTVPATQRNGNRLMRTVYRVLAFIVAAEVAIQAALAVWGVAGLGRYVDEVGVLEKSTFDVAFEGGPTPFPEFVGLMLHGLNGVIVIPALALLLLLSSLFAKVPRGVVFALAVLGLVVVQATLGFGGHAISSLGALHGINALALFSIAMWAGLRVSRASRTAQLEPPADPVTV